MKIATTKKFSYRFSNKRKNLDKSQKIRKKKKKYVKETCVYHYNSKLQSLEKINLWLCSGSWYATDSPTH